MLFGPVHTPTLLTSKARIRERMGGGGRIDYVCKRRERVLYNCRGTEVIELPRSMMEMGVMKLATTSLHIAKHISLFVKRLQMPKNNNTPPHTCMRMVI